MNEQALRQAIALIAAFQMPAQTLHIPEDYVRNYHAIITDLESSLEESLERFRIPGTDIKPQTKYVSRPTRFAGMRSQGFDSVPTGNMYCEKAAFETRLNGLSLYLQMLLTPQEQETVRNFKVKGFGKS